MDSIILQTGGTTVVDGDVIGRVGFAASSETGTNARLVVAKIEAVAEEAFTASDNATEMVFYLAADGAAASKMTLSSAGDLTLGGYLVIASSVPGSTTNKLYNDSGTLKFNGSAIGGGSPGGSDTQIQFNDSSSFGGDSDLVWNKTTNALTVNGSINATTKSFLINHPTKEGAKLQYASLEGPEHGVYVRGQTSDNIIELPEYWSELVDEDSITVHITPVKYPQPNVFVESWDNRKVVLSSDREIMVHYTIYGERKDVDKLKVEW